MSKVASCLMFPAKYHLISYCPWSVVVNIHTSLLFIISFPLELRFMTWTSWWTQPYTKALPAHQPSECQNRQSHFHLPSLSPEWVTKRGLSRLVLEVTGLNRSTIELPTCYNGCGSRKYNRASCSPCKTRPNSSTWTSTMFTDDLKPWMSHPQEKSSP